MPQIKHPFHGTVIVVAAEEESKDRIGERVAEKGDARGGEGSAAM